MAYKLKIGEAAPLSFAALGISEASLEADVEARSTLVLTTGDSLGATAKIAPFQRVLLLDDEDTVRFAGWLDEAPRSARGDTHRVTYRLSGPHRWLARANFVQDRAGLVILGGQAGATGDPQPFNMAIGDVLASALTRYPGSFSHTGTTTFTHQIPSRLRADVDCLTAILSLVSFAPGAVFWWTYDATGHPTLHIGNGTGSAQKTLATATHALSAAELNPRYDLLADVVKVYFVSGNTVSAEQTATSAGDAAALAANRTVLYTYDTTVLNNIPAGGIASALAAWHQTLHIDASATRHSIDWSDHPGEIYGFGGDDLASFAPYKTLLHTIARDLLTGTTELRLGLIPGKTLFKLRDLDAGPAASPVTHAAKPISIGDVDGLQNFIDSIPSPEDFPNPEDFPADATELTERMDDLEARLTAVEAALSQLTGAAYAWRQVQRCDGKTMSIWGSAWQ